MLFGVEIDWWLMCIVIVQIAQTGAIVLLAVTQPKRLPEGPPTPKIAKIVVVKGKKYVLASEVDEHFRQDSKQSKLMKPTKGADLEFLNRKPKAKEDSGIPWYERPDS